MISGRRLALLIALVPLVLALTVAAAGGGLSIPHNDGWAYSEIAARFASAGEVKLVGWNRPGPVGQTLLALPLSLLLPDVLVAQHLTVWILGTLLVLSTFWFFEPALGAARAIAAASTTALFPGLGLLSTSFMADVPAAALGCCAWARPLQYRPCWHADGTPVGGCWHLPWRWDLWPPPLASRHSRRPCPRSRGWRRR